MTKAFPNRCLAPRILSRRFRTREFTQYLALLLFAAFAGSAVAQNALTQTALTYDDGDLFVGFRSTDGTSDYLINIFQPAQFVNAPPGSTFQVAVGNTSADLAVAFGADWYTRIDPNTGRNAVLWAVVGGRAIGASGDPDNTLYSTNPLANPWPRRSDSAQSATQSLIASMGNSFSGNQPTPNNPHALIQNAAGANSYASYQPGGVHSSNISFQTWNPWNEGPPAGVLFFDRIVPGSGPSTVLGSFVLTSDGQLSFTAIGGASPTPSPTPTATATGTPTATATATATGTPSATPTPTATATATPTATATATATAAASPTPTPRPATLANISTRLQVGTGASVMIAGFIVQGSAPKRVIVRAIGPSLSNFGVPNPLADPVLELHGPAGFVTITNDNWKDSQQAEIQATGLPPTDDLESAIVANLAPGNYTAIVSGKNNTIGVALVEVYDLDATGGSLLANISTRGFVQTGDNAMIGGFIVVTQPTRVIIRAIGPSLSNFGVPNPLADPVLELHGPAGFVTITNDNWKDSQQAEIQATGLPPTDDLESAIVANLAPGNYTAIVRGVNNTTGNALVEGYSLQ